MTSEYRELTQDDIGTTLPCGCEVVPCAVPCARHEQRWGCAQTDCGDCEYGVPGVYHHDDCEVQG